MNVRVILPAQLALLAKCDRELEFELSSKPTISDLLDAIENRLPSLRGTIRDPVTQKRRPFVRYFACEADLSHYPAETELPDEVVNGSETFVILGAIAGGT